MASQGKPPEISDLTRIEHSIYTLVKKTLSETDDLYLYKLITNAKKIKVGSLVVNLRICLKKDTESSKQLIFVANKDAKTGLIHVFILDGNLQQSSVLFSTTDQYPVTKLERYIPNILISTMNMIK